jgi:hypothetical protein
VEVTTPVAIVEPVAVEIAEPLEVEVVNPAPPSPPVRWQLVGFTSATYTGAMGGNFGVTQKCQLEFPNSRMCSQEEVAATTSIPSGLVGSAWAHHRDLGAIFTADFSVSAANCTGWTDGIDLSGNNRIRVRANGNPENLTTNCTVENPIACCALVP